MPIDWDATGSWMQAWAGFAQAGAVVLVAYKGADAFKGWKRQKIAERKIDTAEHILDLAYRVRRALDGIRSPMMGGASLERAREKLKVSEPGWLENMDEANQRRYVMSQAIYDRVNDSQLEWDQLWAAMPKARSFFGPELEMQLNELWRQRAAVLSAAEAKARFDGERDEFEESLNRTIWTGYGKLHGKANEVDEAVASASRRIEEILQPILSDTTT